MPRGVPEALLRECVEYADNTSVKQASLQFGISVPRIKEWKNCILRKVKKAPHKKLLSSPPAQAEPKVIAKPRNEMDRKMIDWLTAKMRNNEYPGLADMVARSKQFAADKKSLTAIKHQAYFSALLHRTGLYRKWKVGSIRKKRGAFANPTFKAEEDGPGDVSCVQKVETETPRKSHHSTDLVLRKRQDEEMLKWVTARMESGRRPLLAEISRAANEVAVKIGIATHSSNSWSSRFLVRYRLKVRWDEMLQADRLLKTASSPKYSDEFKESVVDYINKTRLSAMSVANKFGISADLVFKWRREAAENHASAVQDQIADWISQEHGDGKVSEKEVLKKAVSVTRELGATGFHPTMPWCRRFLRSLKEKKDSVVSPERGNDDDAARPSTRLSRDSPSCQTLIEGRSPTRINVKRETVEEGLNGASEHSNAERLSSIGLVSPERQACVRRGFGSFHSSNLAEQIVHAESVAYVPPIVPLPAPTFDEYSASKFPFGLAAREKHFYLDKDCTFINHGAFGATLKEAMDYYHDWQRYQESQPLRFFDRALFPQTVHVQKRLAEFIGCNVSDLSFTTNVTTAINAVLQGLPLDQDCSIYYLNIAYGAVKKMIKHVCERTGAQAVEVTVTVPISRPEDIVSLVRMTLKNGTTLAVFDHIPSNYGFVMPIEGLVSACHQRGVPVLVDGAHALGQVELDLFRLGADYYAGNCHKWFCAPKGCAFLYVNKQLQRYTRGLTISHGYDQGFHSQFLWTGAKDYCSYLSVHALINFWTTVGPANIRQYCRSLLTDAVRYFQSKWDAQLLAPMECHAMMCCVTVPSALYAENPALSYSDAEAIQNQLYSEFNIEVPIKCIEKKLYARISVHLYNSFSEYASLASALLAMSAQN